MHGGVLKGGVEPLVLQELLDARDAAARSEKLRRAGVPEPVGTDVHSHPRPHCPEAPGDHVLAQRVTNSRKEYSLLNS
jgi:hypothetical protein